MNVADLMEEVTVSVSPEDGVIETGKLLLEKKASCAIVEDDDGKLIGLISKEGFVLGVKYLGGNPLEGMKVRDFMEEKFETLRPEDPIDYAVEQLLDVPYRIDRIPVVTRESKVEGMLSKGHIVKIFSEQVHSKFKVKDLMRFEPTCIYDYETVLDVIKKIDESSDKRVMVIRGEKLVGILTILDLAVALFDKRVRKADVFDWDIYSEMKASDVMTRNPMTVKPRDQADKVAALMAENKIGGFPVVDDGIIGVISKTEFVKGYHIYLQHV